MCKRLWPWQMALAVLLLAVTARGAAPPPQPHKPIPQEELDKWAAKLYDGARPREYTDKRLGYVALPLGGIGTGSVAINGEGRLIQWQLFNNFNKGAQVNDTFFAVWARPAGEKAAARLLQAKGALSLPSVERLSFVGEYPIARLTYADPGLPVQVSLEAFNPMVPLNPKDSALPCAIFTFTASNAGDKPCDVAFLATLQNAVGYPGHGGYPGTSHPGFVRNRNELKRVGGLTLLSLGAEPGQPAEMAKPIRLFTNALGRDDAPCRNLAVTEPAHSWGANLAGRHDVLWFERVQGRDFRNAHVEAIAAAIEEGAALLASGRQGSLAAMLATAPRHKEPSAGPAPTEAQPDILFEDFESGTYGNWKVEGKAFGDKPATGTLANQQAVSGFRGKFLVNTYLGGDAPHGTATSKPFTIERRYVNFLIAGGSHEGQTCMNLLVDGKAVRTACGKDIELLEQACWDVGPLAGKQAQLQIVDKHSGGWGHVNIDHILFSDRQLAIPGEAVSPRLADLLPFTCDGLAPEGKPFSLKRPAEMLALDPAWLLIPEAGVQLGPTLRLRNLKLKDGARILLKDPDGEPLLIEGKCGKGKLLTFLADLPRGLSWTPATTLALNLVAYAAGTTFKPATGLDPAHRYWGTMALATPATDATATAQWRDVGKLWADFIADGRLAPSEDDKPSGPGSTWNAALAVPLRVEPGKSASASFFLAWHFPNHHYQGNPRVRIGNMYANWFKDAEAVAAEAAAGIARRADTLAYHDAIYDSTLPYYVIDALTSQADIIRSQTCMWTENDEVLCYEGNACCPMNCTHVWNYAQTMAKLFPSLERNMRQLDLGPCLNPAGVVGHRIAVPPKGPAAGEATDGQCGTILKAYREYLQSPDDAWLKTWWPKIKLATQFLINKDKQGLSPDANLDDWVPVKNRALLAEIVKATEPDGIILGDQPNTYDCSVHGPNPFIGSLYLAALRAAEEMAKVCGDADFAKTCRTIFERGQKNADELMWNPDFGYYIQTYDEKKIKGMQFGWGCHADQTMGQWWADVLDLGYILPKEHVEAALRSTFKHNWRTNFHGHRQVPRVYALDDDKGLLICTWPNGRRPDPVTLYSDEIWTGIEYEVAGALIYQGLLKEGLMVVLGCRDRYDGISRPNTACNVGNPFDEVECGTNYARAMSSWSVLLALQGYTYDGPAGTLGLRPRYQPERHRSFFTAAEGWGVFDQKREARTQTDTLDLRYGHLSLKELRFELPEAAKPKATLTIGAKEVPAALAQDGAAVRLTLPGRTRVAKGEILKATFTW